MHAPSFANRLAVIEVAVVLAAASLVVVVLVPTARAAECQAWNATSGSAAAADLQAVIDSAAAGDTVRVTGNCVGGFTIDKDLVLRSAPGDRLPRLDGRHDTGAHHHRYEDRTGRGGPGGCGSPAAWRRVGRVTSPVPEARSSADGPTYAWSIL